MNNLDFNEMGLELAVRLTNKNMVPKTQESLARIIKKHCVMVNGIFLKQYFRNVKTFEESLEFRNKLLQVTWELISK